MFKLVLKNKAEIILEYLLNGKEVVVGSSEECDIQVKDKTVSLQHCVIKKEDNKFIVRDLKTAYGTLVNGKKIESWHLNIGDKIGIGPYYFLSFREAKSKEDLKLYNLIGIHGDFEGKKYEVSHEETKIGRSDIFNDIVLSGNVDPSVSRRHATIVFQDGQYVLTDKRSRNRTFVNKKEIKEDEIVVLKPKDEILIGHTIFRFVEEGDEDYSRPKKAGIFWVRFKYPFFKFCSITVILTGIFLFFYGLRGTLIIKNKPGKFFMKPSASLKVDTDNINLSQTPESFISEENYEITSSPGIGDLNKDGINEIVFATTNGYLYAWNGKTGRKIWKKPTKIGNKIISSPAIIDINKDGACDIVIGSDDSCLYIVDGPTGKLIYKSEILGGNLRSSPAVYDLNKDGQFDIVICSEQGIVYFIYSPLSEPNIESREVTGNIYSSPVIFLDKGEPNVVVGTIEGKLYFFNSKAETQNIVYITENINKYLGVYLPINEITPTVAVSDLNGDNILDVVVADKQYYITVIKEKTEELLWNPYYIEPISEKPSPLYYSSPVLADLDSDGKPDIIVCSCNGGIFAIKGSSGKLLWKYDTGLEKRIISSPALADLDKDGIADIIVGNEDGSLYVLRGRAKLPNKQKRILFKEIISSIPITSSPVVGDINGDGYLDIVYSQMNDKIGVYSTNTKIFKNQIIWAMFHSDPKRIGVYFYKNKLKYMLSKSLWGIILLSITIFTNLKVKKVKQGKRPPVLPVASKKLKIKK